MATVPETTDDRNHPVIRKAAQAIQTAVTSRRNREKVFLSAAAAMACLAPSPFGSAAAALLVLAAAEGR